MKRNISRELGLAGDCAQYDEYAKRILSNRWVLAWILKETTEEFAELSVRQIAIDCIGKDVEISQVNLHPGETNKCANEEEEFGNEYPERIIGENVEDSVPEEGKIYFDIRFSAYKKEYNVPVKILINVEAQKDFHVGYSVVTRGIFYSTRMISAQLDTEFTSADYSKLKKVYSIWVCMNAPDYIGNAITKYSISQTDIISKVPDVKNDYDKMTVVVICLNSKRQAEENNIGLLGLLNTLFSENLTAKDKEEILARDYGFTIYNDIKEMGHMCNLGEGICERAYERGINQGIEQGIERGEILKVVFLIRNMLVKGRKNQEIAELLEEDIELVQKIAKMIEKDIEDKDIVRLLVNSN